MTTSLRTRVAVAALSGAAVLVAACAPGGSGPDPRPAAADARVGGAIKVAIGPVGSVDPLDAYEPNGLLVARTMCDTLVELDPRTGEVRPGLASSWTITDGGSQIIFRIRDGARFSDGRSVQASDVVHSLSRAASPAFAGRAADLLSPILGFPELRGEEDSDDPRTRRRLVGVQALTGDTVRIQLRRSGADLIRLFAHPVTTPVPKAAIDDDPDGIARRPVCAGPYRLTEPWDPQATSFTLERVEGHEGRSATRTRGGAGYADRIVFSVGADSSTADVVVAPTGAAPPPGFQRATAPDGGAELIGLPHGPSSPYRDAALREALSVALDRDRVAAVTPGRRIPARGFLPPNLVDVFRSAACGAATPERGDPDRARRLLAASGADLGAVPLQVITNDDGPNRAIAEEVARQWGEVLGAGAEVVAQELDDMLAAASSGSGLTGPFRVSWRAPYPSADAHLAALFGGGATHQANLGRWNDPGFDRSLERDARRAAEEEDRVLEHRRLEERLCAALPAIPLTWSLSAVDVRPDRVASATGAYLDPVTGAVDLRELYVRA